MYRKGDVCLVDLDPTTGVEIRKTRPVIIVSNNWINQHSQLVVIVPLTSNIKRVSPSQVMIPQRCGNLDHDSKAATDQIRAIDKSRIVKKLGSLDADVFEEVCNALKNTLDFW